MANVLTAEELKQYEKYKKIVDKQHRNLVSRQRRSSEAYVQRRWGMSSTQLDAVLDSIPKADIEEIKSRVARKELLKAEEKKQAKLKKQAEAELYEATSESNKIEDYETDNNEDIQSDGNQGAWGS